MIRVKLTSSGALECEVEGETTVEVFKKAAELQEVFGERSCGLCGNKGIRLRVRRVLVKKTKKEADYCELVCISPNCGGRLSLGQNIEGGGLFPKRKNEDGTYNKETRGWYKWAPQIQGESNG